MNLDFTISITRYHIQTICANCGKLVPKKHLKEHLGICEQTANVLCCDECGFQTKWQKSFTRHKAKHLKPKKPKPQKKPRKSVSRKKPPKPRPPKKVYKCEFCQHSFKQKSNLQQHLNACKDKKRAEETAPLITKEFLGIILKLI